MQMIEINKLQPHPRNRELFDDIQGERWDDFKNSIVRRSVVEPIVVTQDLVIVSGHQRVQACEELSITSIPCKITHYSEYDERTGNSQEDMILEDLICTNLMQRGVGNVNPMKMARCIQELERIYGIKHGGSRISSPDNPDLKDNVNAPTTQEELADSMGLSVDQLYTYKKLLNLIPEIQELVAKDKLRATVAHKIIAKLPEEEQEEILSKLGETTLSRMTQKEVEKYIAVYKQEKEELLDKNEQLQQELQKERSKPPQVIEKEVIIDNTNYSKINELESLAKTHQKEKEKFQEQLRKLSQEKVQVEIKKQELESRLNGEDEQYEIQKLEQQKKKLELEAHISISDLQIKIHKFIEDSAPSLFLQGAVAASGDLIKEDLLDSVVALEEFTVKLRSLLNSKVDTSVVDADFEIM